MTVLFWIIAVLACADTAFADACDQHQCKKGSCRVDASNSPRCFCDHDPSGDFCDVNFCGDLNCENQAGCEDELFTNCLCKPGFRGIQCRSRMNVKVCDKHQCENGGKCTVSANGGAQCECPPDTSGARCEIRICDVHQCFNGGKCTVDANGRAQCQCPPDTSGARCEIRICDLHQCENGGKCTVDANGRAQCECPQDTSGARCEIKAEQCKTKSDIILIFDASGSIGARNFHKQFDFAMKLFRHFTIGDNDVLFGGIVFSYNAKILFHLDEHKNYADLDQAISNVNYMGSTTNTHLALLNVIKNGMFSTAKGGREDAKDIAILITDGDSSRQFSTRRVARLLKNRGVTIMAIAVGSRVTRRKLEEIVSSPEDIIEAKSYDELAVIEKRVADLVCGNKEPSDEPF